jgi:hypothetical protein
LRRQRIDGGIESREHGVTRVVDDLAPMPGNERGDKREGFLQTPMCGVFVLAAQATITGDVGMQDGDKFTR